MPILLTPKGNIFSVLAWHGQACTNPSSSSRMVLQRRGGRCFEPSRSTTVQLTIRPNPLVRWQFHCSSRALALAIALVWVAATEISLGVSLPPLVTLQQIAQEKFEPAVDKQIHIA